MNNLNPSPQAEFHQCFKCNYEAITDQTLCPKCGKKTFFTASSIRKRGIVTVLCGLFISGLMATISFFVGTMLLGQMKDPEGSKRILDSEFTLLAIFGLFALLIALGLNFMLMGGWMIAFGKHNKYLLWIMLAFVFIVVLAAGLIPILIP
jgi:hypothetical protein